MSPQDDIGRRHAVSRKVAAALAARCGVRPGDAIVVAVSGGADSVALLRALAAIAPARRRQYKLIVGHVQHHLRDDAEGDAAFVAELAKTLGLAFERRDIDVPREGNIEANARRLRYAALADIARQHGARYIATAHHADDQLETVLMRLMRGASVRGMRGIAWRKKVSSVECRVASDKQRQSPDDRESQIRDPQSGIRNRKSPIENRQSPIHLIRPMLTVDRAAVLDFLRQLDQPWREDHTNADASRVRARLRRDVLPVLRELSPRVAQRATELGDHMRELCRWLDQAVDRARERVEDDGRGVMIDRAAMRKMPAPVVTGLLRDLLIDAGVGADAISRRKLGGVVRAVRDTSGVRRTFLFRREPSLAIVVERDAVSIVEP